MLLPREQRSMGSHVWATVASESVPRTYNSLQGLGSLLRGLGSLRIHVRRAPRDGSASTLAEQQPLRRHHAATSTSPAMSCIKPYWSPTTHKTEYDQHVTSA